MSSENPSATAHAGTGFRSGPGGRGFLLRQDWPALGLITASALLWAWCYPRFPLGPLAFFVLVPGMLATARLGLKRAFGYGFLGGLVHNTVMYWWLYNVMKVGPSTVIFLGLIALILFLSLFNGLLGLLFRAALDLRRGLAFYPLLWAGLEVLRSKGEMSFPWNHLGYALGDWNVMIQAGDLLGVFGLSLAMAAANCLLFAFLRRPHRRLAAYALSALALPVALAVYGAWRLGGGPPDASRGSLDIALVQPSIAQVKKWNESYFQEVMDRTWSTMDLRASGGQSLLQGSDLVVLPETAIPDFLRLRPGVVEEFRRRAAGLGAPIMVGSLDLLRNDKDYKPYFFFNSAFLFLPDSTKPPLQYSKIRLVPFSERLPFEDILPLVNYVNLGEGDFSPGLDYQVWGGEARFSPSICYEVIYSHYVREARRSGAKLLINITNDSWFGRSNAPYMHASIARFRAVETGAPMARCANSGISVFYDHRGRILGKTGLFERTVLRRELPLATHETVYLRYGHVTDALFLWSFLLGAPLLLFLRRRAVRSQAAVP